ncbi:hypothetical protein BGX27_008028 [Mortierella sp. AM989]|nr:hypothetical protein BGX27_008028 [Mortierella sp. AM989]
MTPSSVLQTPGTTGSSLLLYSAHTLQPTDRADVVAATPTATTVATTTPPPTPPSTANASTTTAIPATQLSLLNRTTSSTFRVFHIPELAHSIAQYLRPIYISQLRLVSKALYAAYIPYLRIHLHRNSTASWTVFPLLRESDCISKKTVSSNGVETNSEKTAAKKQSKPEAAKAPANDTGTKASVVSGIIESVNSKAGRAIDKGYLSSKLLYGDLVHDITADSMDNFESILPILPDCTNLRTLTITRWSRDLQIFRDVISMTPKLESLSVSFYNTIDLNVFLATLIIYASNNSSEQVNGVAATSSTSSGVTGYHLTAEKDKEILKSKGCGFESLRSLDIKHRVPDINYIRWRVFKSALDKLPNLQHLSLTGVGFRGGKDIANPAIVTSATSNSAMTNTAPLAPFTVSNANSTATVTAPTPHDQDGLGDDDDDDDDDEPRSLEDGNPASSRTYPHLQSLSLTFCECPVPTMLDLDRIFPNLTSLEMNKCRNTWLHVFEPDPHNPTSHLGISSPASSVSSLHSDINTNPTNANNFNNSAACTANRCVPFPLLTRLKLVDRYEGQEDLIYEIVKNRPGLVSLETHQISLNIDTLLPMATHCTNESRFLTRFSLSPCWSNSSTRRDVERLFESPFLAKVNHLYVQQELTEKMFFSSTLTSLHIGAGFARDSVIEYDSVPVWNAILRRLPMLEILKIDRSIKDFLLFEGLGRSPLPIENSDSSLQYNGDSETNGSANVPIIKDSVPAPSETLLETNPAISSSPSSSSTALSTSATLQQEQQQQQQQEQQEQQQQPTKVQDWTGERPYLQELHITFRVACVIQTADLDRELVQRFRFLERLYFSSAKKPVDLEDRKPIWRPGLVIEHRRYDGK